MEEPGKRVPDHSTYNVMCYNSSHGCTALLLHINQIVLKDIDLIAEINGLRLPWWIHPVDGHFKKKIKQDKLVLREESELQGVLWLTSHPLLRPALPGAVTIIRP